MSVIPVKPMRPPREELNKRIVESLCKSATNQKRPWLVMALVAAAVLAVLVAHI